MRLLGSYYLLSPCYLLVALVIILHLYALYHMMHIINGMKWYCPQCYI